MRGGEEVDLRFFAGVEGIYDTGLLPVTSDTTGQPVQPGGLYGVIAQLGAYGVHDFKRSQLSLEYKGDFRHYTNNPTYDGIDQAMTVVYGYQKSRHFNIDSRLLAGTYSNSLFANSIAYVGQSVTPGQALFDNRTTFVEGGMDFYYQPSSRLILTAGGQGFDTVRQSHALYGVRGYTLRGGIERKMSSTTRLGAFYDHNHYDYPRAFGESTIDGFSLGGTKLFDRNRLSVRLLAGGMMVQTEGVEQITLDPLVASILGVSTGVQAYYQKTFLPRGQFSIRRQFRTSALGGEYRRDINPGNGSYLTSVQEIATGGYDYTGVRKLSAGINFRWSTFSAIGQTLGKYREYGGNVHAAYAITSSLHATMAYNRNKQDIQVSSFTNNTSRFQLGITYSPGTIPLSIR
jgi:hypothetical protein